MEGRGQSSHTAITPKVDALKKNHRIKISIAGSKRGPAVGPVDCRAGPEVRRQPPITGQPAIPAAIGYRRPHTRSHYHGLDIQSPLGSTLGTVESCFTAGQVEIRAGGYPQLVLERPPGTFIIMSSLRRRSDYF